jgi:protease I
MMPKKILMLVGDFVEDYEAMVPFQGLQMVGHEIHATSPEKKAGDFVKTAVHDFEGDQTYTEKPGHRFPVTVDFESLDPEEYTALIIPGGRAPEHLRMNARVLEIIRHFSKENKPIAAICHGIQLLTTADVVAGRLCTGYPALRDDVVRAGGKWAQSNGEFSNVVVDGNLVTAPAWPAHPAWLSEFLKLLGTKIER